MKISYDIRGRYPEEINENFVLKVINALDSETLIIGYDTRESSIKIANFIKKLAEEGKIKKTILWLGVSTTPLTAFAGKIFNTISLMITASHLGNEYNGLKISENGFAWEKEKYFELLEKINNGVVYEFENGFKEIKEEVLKNYKKWLNLETDEIEIRNEENNPGFIILSELGFKVKTNKNARFEFDSDCDRLYVYNSEKLHNDLVGIVLAKHLTKKGDNVIFNVGTSVLVYYELEDRDLEMVKTGRNNMIQAMKGAKFGFEYSGHFYFYDENFDYYLDDGLKALSEVLKIENFLEEYNKLLKKTNISKEYRVKGTLDDFKELIKEIKKRAQNLIDIDGYRFEFVEDDRLVGFYLIRQSNTEEKVSIRFEHFNKEKFEELKNITEKFLS